MVKNRLVILMMVVLILFLPVIVLAGTVELPETGQTTCYDSYGDEICCTGTGQDGDIKAGVAWPYPRFTDNGDSTVTDDLTGLMWTKDGNLMAARDPEFDADDISRDGIVTWQHALDYVAKLNREAYLGYTDWRVPNVNELRSLINVELPNTATWLNTQGFSNVQSNYYWSSTSYAYYPSYAWGVVMWYGYMSFIFNKTSNNYVWPVRSGQSGLFGSSIIQIPKTGQTTCYDSNWEMISCAGTGQDGEIQAGVLWPDPRFTDNGESTVSDNLTGLMWTKDGNLMAARDPEFDADDISRDGRVTWQHALDYVAKLNREAYLGYTDWRLPNVNELRNLINVELPNTATWLNTQGFSNVQSNFYWSSTSDAYSTRGAWFVNMRSGYMYDGYKTNYFYVWPVRSGQVGPSDHSITGTVTEDSVGLSGVTMTLSRDASESTTTAADGTYSFASLADGSYTITPGLDGYTFTPASRLVTVAGGDISCQDFSAVQENRAPVLSNIGSKSVKQGHTLSFTVSGTDPDGDDLTYSASNMPAGATFDAYTKTFSWIPDCTQAGLYSVTFTVGDGELTDSEVVTITVNENSPPAITFDPAPPYSVNEGSTLTFNVKISDPDGDDVGAAYSALPFGMDCIDKATGSDPVVIDLTCGFTPNYTQSGEYNVEFTWFDNVDMGGCMQSFGRMITITVNNINRLPELDTIGPRSIKEGSSLNFTVNGSDPEGDTLTYKATALPAGASFDISTGNFSYTPGYAVSTKSVDSFFDVFFEVSDGNGGTDSETVRITVEDVNRLPVANAGTDQTVEATSAAGASVTLDGSGSSDPDGDALTFDWSGASITATGSTPTVTVPIGTHTITLTVTDTSGATATDTVQVTVQDTTPPTITSSQTPAPNANGWNNSAVTVTFTATDTVSGTIPCEIVALSLSSNSPISATVNTEGYGQTVTVTCTDEAGNSATASHTVNIDLTQPDISIGGCPSTVVLNGTAEVTVSVADTLSGLASQSLADGSYTLDTSTVGTKTFTVTAQDNAGNSNSGTCNYQVVYNYPGTNLFKSPLASPPAVNSAKAGSTVPVKWQLTDVSGAFISDTGAVSGITSYAVSCESFISDTINEVPVDTSGNSGLRFDAATNQYIYTWKTPGAPGCHVLKLTLNDGSSYLANFQLK